MEHNKIINNCSCTIILQLIFIIIIIICNTCYYALVQSLKTKFRNCMKEKERSIVSHVVLSGITKRYRKIAEASLGFSRRRWKTAKRFAEAGLPCKQRVASKMAEALKSEVKKFYIRDDVSRSTTGKKETRTMLKEKKQKRFLTDTMQTLHARFISEFHDTISYSLFCRLRPYWVVVPTAADRSTCQCNTHENLAFKANRMKQLKFIETEYLDMLAAKVACDVGNKTCMYGECTICKNAQLPIRYTDGGNSVVTDVQFGHLFLVCIKYVPLQEVICGLFRKISHCS